MITHCVIAKAPSEPDTEENLRYDVLIQLENSVEPYEGLKTNNRIWHKDQKCVPARVGTNWIVFVEDGEPMQLQILHGAASSEECE